MLDHMLDYVLNHMIIGLMTAELYFIKIFFYY